MVIVHTDLSLLHGWPQCVEFSSPPWTMKVVCHPACPHHQGFHCYLLMQVSLVLYELLVLPIPAGLSPTLHWFWTCHWTMRGLISWQWIRCEHFKQLITKADAKDYHTKALQELLELWHIIILVSHFCLYCWASAHHKAIIRPTLNNQ
jgi:hypothetical protein